MTSMKSGRVGGIAAILGFLIGAVAGGFAARPPALQTLLEQPLISAGVVVLTVATVIGLFWWARQSGSPDQMALAAAITISGVVVVIVNIIAPAVGWWQGPYFDTSIVPLALLTGLKAAGVYFGLMLLGYRWLAAQRPRLALILYLALILLLIVSTVLGDQAVLESGLFTFGHGYQIWHDALLGVVFFTMPLILYRALARRWHAAEHPPESIAA